ncbi:MAG: hypothetical protein AAFR98_06515 [Pseudomonadota bacterium]
MPVITHVKTTTSAHFLGLTGATGVEYFMWGDTRYYLVSASASGDLILFREQNNAFAIVDTLDLSAAFGFQFHGDIFSDAQGGGAPTVFVLGGVADAEVNSVTVSASGFGSTDQSGEDLQTSVPSDLVTVTLNQTDYIIYQVSGHNGLEVAESDGNGYDPVSSLVDTSDLPLGDVSAIATATVGDSIYVFAASAFDTGLAAFTLTDTGDLTLVDTVSPQGGSGFWLPQTLTTVTVGAYTFLLMGSAGTNSITSYLIKEDGTLIETDHLLDDGITRFQGVTEIVGFEVDGRGFIAATGSDDGFSIIEVLENGDLVHIGTVEDDFETALQNVSDLDVGVDSGIAVIVTVSDTDHGISEFEFDPSQAPPEPTHSGYEHPLPEGVDAEDLVERGDLQEDVFLF